MSEPTPPAAPAPAPGNYYVIGPEGGPFELVYVDPWGEPKASVALNPWVAPSPSVAIPLPTGDATGSTPGDASTTSGSGSNDPGATAPAAETVEDVEPADGSEVVPPA